MHIQETTTAHQAGSLRPDVPAARPHAIESSPFPQGWSAHERGIRRKLAGETGSAPQRSRRSSRGWLAPTLIGSAAALGTAALYNIQQSRTAEREHPPIGRFLTVDGVRLHYIERGQGEPLLLIHGNGTMIQDFTSSGLVDRLADRYRVIVIDRPGYGFSSRPRKLWTPRAHASLFEKALRRLGVEQATVLGHSWGTMVAVALALQAPDLVRRLVLASGYYFPTLRADTFLLSPPAIPVIGDALRYTVSPLVARAVLPAMIRRMFEPASIPDRFEREFPKSLMVPPVAVARRSRGCRPDDAVGRRVAETLPRSEATRRDHRGHGRQNRRRRASVRAASRGTPPERVHRAAGTWTYGPSPRTGSGRAGYRPGGPSTGLRSHLRFAFRK